MSIRTVRLAKPQIAQTVMLTAVILAIVLALDFLVNVMVMPGVTPYTPLATALITLLVTPAAIAYVLLQNDKVQRAHVALEEERIARLAADGASAAKTRFLANMSHELRTPLNAIIGYAEIIEEDAGVGASATDSRRIQKSARHLLGLINEILDHVKLEAGELGLASVETELRTLFDEVVEFARPRAEGNGNEFQAAYDLDIGVAWIDPVRVKQCMRAIASNAAKFTSNGRVVLRMSADGEEGFLFEAIDSGAGIDDAALPLLFRPFMQGDASSTREQDGAGIGLSLTKQLMDAMGGSVSVVSTKGVGSIFTLRFKRGAPASNVVTLAA
ncbi:MAG: ATP-binding protein [Hyphomonadaceae bacterium]